jgi:hypothetical protein
MAEWTGEMARYLRSLDVYKHPISTSFCCTDPAVVWNLPEMDFAVTHTYSTHNSTDMGDNAQYWTNRMASEYRKPVYVAETGEGLDASHGVNNDVKGAVLSLIFGVHDLLGLKPGMCAIK